MIYMAFMLNLIVLTIRLIFEILLLNHGIGEQALIRYALNSFAAFFFGAALLLEILEWRIIGSMVNFQAHLPIYELEV